MADLPDLPLAEMPEIVSRAPYGTTGPVETPVPADTPEPFGYFAKVKPPLDTADDADLEFERPPFHKLFAPDVPIATAAIAGGESFRPEPRTFLGDDTDAEETEVGNAIQPIRRLFAEGIYRTSLATVPTQEPPARRSSFTRSEADTIPTPTPKETPTPKLITKLHRDSDGFLWQELFDGDELKATHVIYDESQIDPEEIAKYAPLEKTRFKEAEPESAEFLSALKQVILENPREEDEAEKTFIERLNAALVELGQRPKLSYGD